MNGLVKHILATELCFVNIASISRSMPFYLDLSVVPRPAEIDAIDQKSIGRTSPVARP